MAGRPSQSTLFARPTVCGFNTLRHMHLASAFYVEQSVTSQNQTELTAAIVALKGGADASWH